MPKKTVFIVGNPMLKQDSMPLEIMPLLQKMLPQFEFVPFESTRMDVPHNTDAVFVDTVRGLTDVRVLDDIGAIEPTSAVSLHDFDLGTQLKVMKKFGMLGKVKIICVPAKGKPEEIAKKVAKLL